MKRILLITLYLPLLFVLSCSSNKPQVESIKNGVVVHTSGQNTKIQFYSGNIVRIMKWLPEGTDKKLSLSVIMDTLPQLSIKVDQNSNDIVLTSDKMEVSYNKASGSISYSDKGNKELLAESGTAFTPVVYSGDSSYNIQQDFELTPNEGIYGLGQHQYGYMNYRGKTVKLVQTNTDAVNPFLVSTHGYGILWDNYSKTIYKDDGNNKATLWSDVGDNIDYYFISGANMDSIIAGYRKLTGEAPMYGKWAYGYWQSKEHYSTEDEVLSVAEKYRRLKMPIDNIIQDWDGRENWGSMEFAKRIYPTPMEMTDRLHKMHFHMMISIWPACGPNTSIYKDMLKRRYLYTPVGWAGFKYYDAYNPGANKLYWQYLKKGLAAVGIDAWWIDSTEPDVVNALTKDATEYELKKMGSNYLGTFARYLNPYSLVMTSGIYSHWRKDYPNRRAYILTRSTFAGQQRNAATTWSGDIGASWEVYRHQISAGINHSMSGIPYWTFDIGAFVLGAYDGVFCNGGKDPAYQELYARMFQFGAFCPIFRSHGSETPREIWEMGEFVKPILKFDNLRYRLLPYIYSQAWKVTSNGYTIMRGLPMDFSDDKKTYNIDDQYMFGPSIMVCPVTNYMYHTPPQASVKVGEEFFRTDEGKPGLKASYYKDDKYQVPGKETIDSTIDDFWYTGRPDYVTDSMFSIRWEGKLVPKESGKYQFHLKSFDNKRIILDGDTLSVVYTSTEQYMAPVNLVAGKEYSLVVETENSSTGAARMQLFWKTPSIFAREEVKKEQPKTRSVYLPSGTRWIDFWTGESLDGGQTIVADAPIDKIPLLVKAGSIIPMGPFVQYAAEKSYDDLEIRVYPGANGSFTLYEDENDNYNYEKGQYSTITLTWNDAEKTLTLGKRYGHFPGMLKERKFSIVVVEKGKGVDIEIPKEFDKVVSYNGDEQTIKL